MVIIFRDDQVLCNWTVVEQMYITGEDENHKKVRTFLAGDTVGTVLFEGPLQKCIDVMASIAKASVSQKACYVRILSDGTVEEIN